MAKMSDYPSAADALGKEAAAKPAPAPGMEPGKGGGELTQDNPVYGALQTIAKWVSALQAKGSPQAEAATSAFKSFLEALGAGSIGEMGQEKGGAVAPEPPAGPAPARNMDAMSGGRGQMMGNQKPKVM